MPLPWLASLLVCYSDVFAQLDYIGIFPELVLDPFIPLLVAEP